MQRNPALTRAFLDQAQRSAPADRPLIALDADGVLVDYRQRFGDVWALLRGHAPVLVNERSYHPLGSYAISREEWTAHRTAFFDLFNREGWRHIPAKPGAAAACRALIAAGFDLVCVTSMPRHRWQDRLACLQDQGFPIDHVATCPRLTQGVMAHHPKQPYLARLRATFMVDDLAENFHGIQPTRPVFVDNGCDDIEWPASVPVASTHVVPSMPAFAAELLAFPGTAWEKVQAWDHHIGATLASSRLVPHV